jgi:7,8-dihydropterin-6-yl-methyl-4-(beta-D-ribofuranosyl)aminobenzene 5'-phosphate synthase
VTRACRVMFAVVMPVLCMAGLQGQQASVRMTYLYDNTGAVRGATPDWGFACLVEAHGRTVLFDTGANADILRRNLETLKIKLDGIDALVLSHDHGDHTGGLAALGRRPGLPAYFAQGFAPSVVARLTEAGFKTTPVTRAVQIFPGISVSDEMSLKVAGASEIVEDALLVDTPQGLVVIVGCAHPGIVAMLTRIRQQSGRPIYMAIGGFHLLQTPPGEIGKIVAAFKSLGIAYAGPTHCTGDEAIRQFRQAYGDHFIAGGVGTVVTVPVPAKSGR